jgi:hypothetical protein
MNKRIVSAIAACLFGVGAYCVMGYWMISSADTKEQVEVRPVTVENSGRVVFELVALAEQKDAEGKIQRSVNFTVTNPTSDVISVLQLKFSFFSPLGKLKGGAFWLQRIALRPGGTRTVSLPIDLPVDSDDFTSFGWTDDVPKPDREPAQKIGSTHLRDRAMRVGLSSNAVMVPQGCTPPCDPANFCKTALESAQSACGGAGNNNKLASFNCSVSCTACTYSFTCKP